MECILRLFFSFFISSSFLSLFISSFSFSFLSVVGPIAWVKSRGGVRRGVEAYGSGFRSGQAEAVERGV